MFVQWGASLCYTRPSVRDPPLYGLGPVATGSSLGLRLGEAHRERRATDAEFINAMGQPVGQRSRCSSMSTIRR
jgi:hypothetical protein